MPDPLIVDVGEAKTRLSHLIALAERGSEVVIACHGRPAVRLTPVETQRPEFGFMKLDVPDSDLFEPMSAEELNVWEDGRVFLEEPR